MKKILVIDDEEWLREMIHLALKQKGFDVIEAANGADGHRNGAQGTARPHPLRRQHGKGGRLSDPVLAAQRSAHRRHPVHSDDRPGRQRRHAARHGTGRRRLPAETVHHRRALRRRGRAPEKGADRARRSRTQAGQPARQHQPDACRTKCARRSTAFLPTPKCSPPPPPRSSRPKLPKWARKSTSPASGWNGSSKTF